MAILETKKSVCRENIESLAIAVLVIVFIEVFVARSFVVDGPSMQPTFYTGERLVVNRLVYQWRPPHTGDIVVLIPPHDEQRLYIKRVIAGPDQTVEIRKSKVYVDGEPLTEPYIKEKTFNDFPLHVVPEGDIFVMGDNRNNSLDSREDQVGFIPLPNVIGKAAFIFWPFNKLGVIANPVYARPVLTPSDPDDIRTMVRDAGRAPLRGNGR